MSPPKYRVAKSTAEEIQSGATFAPGEEAVGIDPTDPEVARKIEEGRFVEIREKSAPAPSAAVLKKAEELSVDLGEVTGSGKRGAITVPDVQRTHDNQEASK